MSSSESENIKLLHSAIDHDFINEILTQAASSSQNSLPSLRPKEIINCTNELKVTPGFQKHVAKHLDAIIQKNIKEVSPTSSASSTTVRGSTGGIRLFSHSKSVTTERDLEAGNRQEPMPSFKRRKRELRKRSSSDDENAEEFQRISSAAVSPEWVLQKKGAYGKCEQGKVVKLKDAGNGQLTVIASTE